MTSHDGTGAKEGLEKQEPASENAFSAAQPETGDHPQLDASLTEDAALSLLKRVDLAPEVLEQISKIGELLKYRKVKLALVEHPKTPRHVSLPLIRQLYTFDLMQVALTPVVPADVKHAADETLCNRLDTIGSGERLSLAHRGSGRIAEALLSDAESRVMQAALHNGRLTESSIVRVLTRASTHRSLRGCGRTSFFMVAAARDTRGVAAERENADGSGGRLRAKFAIGNFARDSADVPVARECEGIPTRRCGEARGQVAPPSGSPRRRARRPRTAGKMPALRSRSLHARAFLSRAIFRRQRVALLFRAAIPRSLHRDGRAWIAGLALW